MDVLVVDDEEDIRVLLELYLAGRGHTAVLAASATAARAELAVRPYDAILLDVSLPDEEGPDLARSLREQGLLPPRVALLSGVRPVVLAELAGDLDVAHVTKPFDIAALDDVLGTLLSADGTG